MKIYRIVGGTFVAGVGVQLLLLAAQADSRRHNLEPFTEEGGAALVTTKAPLEFKAGEVLGVVSVPKSMSAHVAELTGKPERKSAEATLVAALKAIEEESEKAARFAERRAAEAARLIAQREKDEADWIAEFAATPALQLQYADAAAYVAARRDPSKV